MTLQNKLPKQDIEQIQHQNDANAKRVLLIGKTSNNDYLPISLNNDGKLILDTSVLNFIKIDGTSVTTAQIPFAEGIRIDKRALILGESYQKTAPAISADFKSYGSVVFSHYRANDDMIALSIVSEGGTNTSSDQDVYGLQSVAWGGKPTTGLGTQKAIGVWGQAKSLTSGSGNGTGYGIYGTAIDPSRFNLNIGVYGYASNGIVDSFGVLSRGKFGIQNVSDTTKSASFTVDGAGLLNILSTSGKVNANYILSVGAGYNEILTADSVTPEIILAADTWLKDDFKLNIGDNRILNAGYVSIRNDASGSGAVVLQEEEGFSTVNQYGLAVKDLNLYINGKASDGFGSSGIGVTNVTIGALVSGSGNAPTQQVLYCGMNTADATGIKLTGQFVIGHNSSSNSSTNTMNALNQVYIHQGSGSLTNTTNGIAGASGGRARFLIRSGGTGSITIASCMSTGILGTTAVNPTITDWSSYYVEPGTNISGVFTRRMIGMWIRNQAAFVSGASSVNDYGIRIEKLTRATNNYEIALEGEGGIFFRVPTSSTPATEFIYSSAASNLDIRAASNLNFRIGATAELVITSTQVDIGSATTDVVNFIAGANATAPSTTTAGSVTNRYGGATNFLGDPDAWLTIKRNGTTYKIPLYT